MKFRTRLAVLTCISLSTLSMNYVSAKEATKPTVKPSHSAEMTSVMNDNLVSARSLITMGSKMIADGNSTGESERMMMGAKMMISGLEIVNHQMEHSHMKSKSKTKTAVSPMSKDIIAMIKKMADESSMSMMRMGNKMVKDGEANLNGQKMISGGEILENGMMIHHLGMMDHHH